MQGKIYKIALIFTFLALPFFASAQLIQTGTLLMMIKNLITIYLIPIAFTLALLLFFWGVVKYIWSVGTEKEQGKKVMVWGIVALFVMSSVWGLVAFLRIELNIGSEQNMPIPTIGN
ncbi:MAG: hypothetical protein JW740_01460 [Candidatus Zambryskibacteria bacterium]|nr:hypothetical protein [Candidatus Zambryskibacteria bacterium]